MVFFVCEGCNESLKKNQVDKHAMVSAYTRAMSSMCVFIRTMRVLCAQYVLYAQCVLRAVCACVLLTKSLLG